jgi:hypothetical protein
MNVLAPKFICKEAFLMKKLEFWTMCFMIILEIFIGIRIFRNRYIFGE